MLQASARGSRRERNRTCSSSLFEISENLRPLISHRKDAHFRGGAPAGFTLPSPPAELAFLFPRDDNGAEISPGRYWINAAAYSSSPSLSLSLSLSLFALPPPPLRLRRFQRRSRLVPGLI